MIAKQTVYLDESRKKAVLAGPTARFLLVHQGQEIPEARYKDVEDAEALIGAEPTKASKKADAARELETREESAPAPKSVPTKKKK